MGHTRPRIHSPIRTTTYLYRSCTWPRQVRFFFLFGIFPLLSPSLIQSYWYIPSQLSFFQSVNSTHLIKLIRWTHRLRPLWGFTNRNRTRYPDRLCTPLYHHFKHRNTPPTRERRCRKSRSQIRSTRLRSCFHLIVASFSRSLGSWYWYKGVEVGELC